MIYNLTKIVTNGTGIVSITTRINDDLAYGLLGIIILLVLAAILFLSFYASNGDAARSMGATSFISFLASLMLYGLGFINSLTFFVSLLLLAASLVIIRRQ